MISERRCAMGNLIKFNNIYKIESIKMAQMQLPHLLVRYLLDKIQQFFYYLEVQVFCAPGKNLMVIS